MGKEDGDGKCNREGEWASGVCWINMVGCIDKAKQIGKVSAIDVQIRKAWMGMARMGCSRKMRYRRERR
jgi:hypothetical protein